MILDKVLQLSSAQAITVTAASTDYIDQLAAGDVLGDGDVFLVVKTGTALTGGTSVTISLQTDDDAAFGTPTTVYTGPAILTASLTANTNLAAIRLPLGLERYIRVNYTIAGTFVGGTVDAFIVTCIDKRMP